MKKIICITLCLISKYSFADSNEQIKYRIMYDTKTESVEIVSKSKESKNAMK